ncbi:MAG: PepSY-like domain-containing protein [Muribaculaceae bacterium]
MKLASVTVGVAALIGCSSNAKQQVELPDLAEGFVSQNFASCTIDEVRNDSADVYQVALADGTQLLFNSDGMWQKVKFGSKGGSTDRMLPYAASAYLHEIYPDKKVIVVERDIPTGLIRVSLDDGLEIVFTSDGEVV